MDERSTLLVPRGFRASGVKAGIKPSGGDDVAILLADGPSAAAGTFTTNRVCAAPVKWCRELLPRDDIRAIVVNSGNANAATGEQGLSNVRRTAERAAAMAGCAPEQVLVASTGVIGHQLPMDQLERGIESAYSGLSDDPTAFEAAARAIMTTDTRPKTYCERGTQGGQDYTLLGLAKGAAMIGPRMATMLAFLLTDRPCHSSELQSIVRDAVDATFNCVSVEGHASTNDTVLLLSSAPTARPMLGEEERKALETSVRSACASLAQQIARDGEGATHFITINVEGCATVANARAIARCVAESPLVKTAIHGADPNWGRIVSAAGYAGVPFAEEELSLAINQVPVYRNGTPTAFDEASLSRSLRDHHDVTIQLTLQSGRESSVFWTCDLTAEYVRLNADYTT